MKNLNYWSNWTKEEAREHAKMTEHFNAQFEQYAKEEVEKQARLEREQEILEAAIEEEYNNLLVV